MRNDKSVTEQFSDRVVSLCGFPTILVLNYYIQLFSHMKILPLRKLFIAFYFDGVVHQMWFCKLYTMQMAENHVSQSYACV